MDWRFIAALSSAGVAFSVVAIGAYTVIAAKPAELRKYASPPSLLSPGETTIGTTAPGQGLAQESNSRPAADPASPFAPAVLSNTRPAQSLTPVRLSVSTEANAIRPAAMPSPALAASPFAPTSAFESAAADEEPGPTGASISLAAASSRPVLDLPRPSSHDPKSPLLHREAKHDSAARVATLTPAGEAHHATPPRPVIEVKKPSILPESHAAIPMMRYQGVLTSAEMARVRRDLRLTPDQEPKWPPVEAALSEMGREQITLLRHGQEPRVSPNDWPPQRLYSIAGPLLMSLRPDQKDQVRRLCHSLGFDGVATML
jgi:hypothetical protein